MMKKMLGVIVGFLIMGLVALFAGYVEAQYQYVFPNFSERDLTNIEAGSNIVLLILAVYLGIKAYKRVAKQNDSNLIQD